MPKMKSNRGAAKRFRALGSGKFKRAHCGKRHNLSNKTRKRNRNLLGMSVVDDADMRSIRRMLPYAKKD